MGEWTSIASGAGWCLSSTPCRLGRRELVVRGACPQSQRHVAAWFITTTSRLIGSLSGTLWGAGGRSAGRRDRRRPGQEQMSIHRVSNNLVVSVGQHQFSVVCSCNMPLNHTELALVLFRSIQLSATVVCDEASDAVICAMWARFEYVTALSAMVYKAHTAYSLTHCTSDVTNT